jgi:hypothetical protein
LLAGVGQAKATTIDFSGYSDNTPISSLDGVTFSVFGGPAASGTPTTGLGNYGYESLTNSPDYGASINGYPTDEVLDLKFSSPVSGVSMNFNAEGADNEFYTAYDSSHSVVSTGSLDPYEPGTVLIPGSGIAEIQLNNGTGGGYNWVVGMQSLTFSPAAVPEPASLTLLGLGAVSLAGYGLRRRKQAVKA